MSLSDALDFAQIAQDILEADLAHVATTDIDQHFHPFKCGVEDKLLGT